MTSNIAKKSPDIKLLFRFNYRICSLCNILLLLVGFRMIADTPKYLFSKSNFILGSINYVTDCQATLAFFYIFFFSYALFIADLSYLFYGK